MPRKSLPCPGCGKPTDPRTRTRKGYCSAQCGITAAIEAAQQMRARSGPYWDRFVRKMTEVHGKPPSARG